MSETDLYNQLIDLNKALFEGGHYEASYHLLCAAKHLADDLGNRDELEALLTLAQQQSDWVSKHAPENALVRQYLLDGTKVNLYKSLFEQLKGRIQIAETSRIIQNLRKES